MDLSHFASRINSNYVPTDEEFSQISALLSDPISKLKQLQDEMQELEERLDQRYKEHEKLEDEIRDYRRLISPVRRLPMEVLQEIFIHCLPIDHAPPLHAHHPPLLLTRICSGWRTLALSTPRIWASIHIAVPNPSATNYGEEPPVVGEESYEATVYDLLDKRSAATQEWLERSGACPLHISVHSWSSRDNKAGQVALNSILKFSPRWRNLQLVCPSISMQCIAELPASDLPILQTISIAGNSGTYHSHVPPTYLWRESGLMRAPLLQEVTFRQMPEDPTTFPLNWAQLTSLTLQNAHWNTQGSPSLTSAFRVLKSCRNLVTCRLEQLPLLNDFDESLGTILLPSLKVFAITNGGGDITAHLSSLVIPSLEEFEFFGGSQWGAPPAPRTSLHTLLSRTSNTIRTFTTDSKPYSTEEFLDYLRLCPHLTSLSIRRSLSLDSPPIMGMASQPDSIAINDNFLNLLTYPDEAGNCLCPELENFECHANAAFSDLGMLDFIIRKQTCSTPGVEKLKRMAVNFNRKLKMTTGAQTEQFVQDGLKLEVSYIGGYYGRNPHSALEGLPPSALPPLPYYPLQY